MDAKARHDLGAHYTSEENILKVIRPLFLDQLRAEFDGLVGRDDPIAPKSVGRGVLDSPSC